LCTPRVADARGARRRRAGPDWYETRRSVRSGQDAADRRPDPARAKAKRLAQQMLAEAHREFTAFGALAWASRRGGAGPGQPAAGCRGHADETERGSRSWPPRPDEPRSGAAVVPRGQDGRGQLARLRKLGITPCRAWRADGTVASLTAGRLTRTGPAHRGRRPDHAIAAQAGLLAAGRDPVDTDGIEPEKHHLVSGITMLPGNGCPSRPPAARPPPPARRLGHTRPVPLHDEPAMA